MCVSPKIFNGYEVSCRECDQCAATYKNTWVARAFAQMHTHPHAVVFTLTYADKMLPIGDSEIDFAMQPPLGALVYRYKDVQLLWKRLRNAAAKKKWTDFDLKYICVGIVTPCSA